MLKQIENNKEVLLYVKERGKRDNVLFPLALNLLQDDFAIINHVVSILKPVRDVSVTF